MRVCRVLCLLLVPVVFCLCQNRGKLQLLADIEEHIQADPKTALRELEQLDRASLETDKEKALFYLLYSIALDKNYIDLKSDSLINNAVQYYSSHGDKLHRFYTYYYLGRIYANDLKYDKALSAYIQSERFIDDSTPQDYQARLYFNKSRVYLFNFAGDKALASAIKAKDLSKALENPDFFMPYALNVSNLLYLSGEYEESAKIILEIKEWMSKRGISPSIDYFRTLFRQALASQVSLDSLNNTFNDYKQACEYSGVAPELSLLSDYYIETGNVKDAVNAFSKIKEPDNDDPYEAVKYYNTKAKLCNIMGDTSGYYSANAKYQSAVESINLSVFNNDIRFLEERDHNTEERKQSKRKISILIAALLASLAAGSAAAYVLYHKLKRNRKSLNEARKEYALITNVFSNSEDNTPDDIKKVLETRILALRPYITQGKEPKPKGRKAIETISAGRREMLSSIGMLYALSYPKFTAELSKRGLNSEEIGLCSLYVCGYSSKEMIDLLDKGDIYHLNSKIRNNIGEEIGTITLRTWLKELFATCTQSAPQTQ